MTETTTTPGVELERREAAAELGRPLPAMDDGEFAGLYRTARALAESGLFKDAGQAGQAFAKILAGRDLGLTPFEAMSSLHVLEGKIEASGDLHATRVREREGYDYRVHWLKAPMGAALPTTKDDPLPEGIEAVASAAEDLADLRPVVGCAIEFLVDGERRGVSRWTLADSLTANLTRDRGSKTSNHVLYPRAMYFNRAMAAGVALHVPEVMGGLRVYGPGELPRAGGEDLTAGAGDGGDVVSLPTAVEAIVARARELGHVGLSNRETAAMVAQTGGDVLERWMRQATQTLNRYAAGKAEPVENVAERRPLVTLADFAAVPGVASAVEGEGIVTLYCERGKCDQVREAIADRHSAALSVKVMEVADPPFEGDGSPQAPQEGPETRESEGEPVDGDVVPEGADDDSTPEDLAAKRQALEADMEQARLRANAATSEGEYDAANAEVEALRERLAGMDPAQGRMEV